ncbi:MAG: methyl-accepting chemotaxis protein [Chromatiaceae bacterium]|jgi:twitching motility protein PilJ|nr:methyl-accepting chemotaxis protein [Chromatiaceae bacterium]
MAAKSTSAHGARGRGKANGSVVLLAVLLTISLALAVASVYHGQRWGGLNERYLQIATGMQTGSQELARQTREAASGSEAAFNRLRALRDEVQGGLQDLKLGIPAEGLPPSPAQVADLLGAVETAWPPVRERAEAVLNAREDITTLRTQLTASAAALPELIAAMDALAERMADADADPDRVLLAARQVVLLERITATLSDLLAGGGSTGEAGERLSVELAAFADGLKALSSGDRRLGLSAEDNPDLRKGLDEVGQMLAPVRAGVDKALGLMPAATPALADIGELDAAAGGTRSALGALIEAYRQTPGRLAVGPFTAGNTTALVFGALAALFLVLLGAQLLAEARRREAASLAQNESNQQAILRLLDEMGDLADGDLTVEATVTEDITGAIADSINYAVDALRALVTTINETSAKVASSAQETRDTATRLAEASEVQTQQISQATAAIMSMTQAIDEVARNATESAEVASRSVVVAGRGAQTVRDTIQGMDAIREQIQETSKRIKRLGESSQEIGEIVELIDDIADQTNILALNAAMQAAMAGEAGRGFAVVADEVQRLAERSSNATKQIEALVRTIQADTSEAVSSMEASTAGVVEGANLAENAGDALREIENVSNYIADLTRRIADSAQHQSREAGNINTTVSAIQQITETNTESTRRTAQSVEALADLAVDLQRSVAGFRLP